MREPPQVEPSQDAVELVLETEVRVCDDPRWDTALFALNGYERQGLGWVNSGKCNPRLIGDLLARGISPHLEVLLALAKFLSPPAGYRGPRLIIEVPRQRTIRQSSTRVAEKRKARIRLEELLSADWSYEAAVSQVGEEFKKKRTWVTELRNLSDAEIVLEASKWLGNAKVPFPENSAKSPRNRRT